MKSKLLILKVMASLLWLQIIFVGCARQKEAQPEQNPQPTQDAQKEVGKPTDDSSSKDPKNEAIPKLAETKPSELIPGAVPAPDPVPALPPLVEKPKEEPRSIVTSVFDLLTRPKKALVTSDFTNIGPNKNIPMIKPIAPKTPVKLTDNWLGGTEAPTPETFETLVSLASNDQETLLLLNTARSNLGFASYGDLSKMISVCAMKQDSVPSSLVFNRKLQPISTDEILGIEDSHNHIVEEAKAADDNNSMILSYDYSRPDFIIIYSTKKAPLCFSKKYTYIEAYETLIHDLYHYGATVGTTTLPFTYENFLETYANSEDFVNKYSMAEGGEFKALAATFTADIRLRGSKINITESLRPAFDDQGNLINSNLLVKYLLSPLFSYKAGFQAAYKRFLAEIFAGLTKDAAWIGEFAKSRKSDAERRPIRFRVDQSYAALIAEQNHWNDLLKQYAERMKLENVSPMTLPIRVTSASTASARLRRTPPTARATAK